jgi:hypothetical protein
MFNKIGDHQLVKETDKPTDRLIEYWTMPNELAEASKLAGGWIRGVS